MKLQAIGTGAIIVPEASASALIDDTILVDCGAGTFKQLLRLKCSPEKIETVLITHLHSDHFMDVPFMMLSAKKLSMAGKRLTIFLPEGGIKATHEIAKYLWDPGDTTEAWWPQNVELVEYQNEQTFESNGATVRPVEVSHGNLKASGFVIAKDGASVGFSGDSIMCDGVTKIVEASNWAVLDSSCPEAGNEVHMGLNDIYAICDKYPDKMIVATHMYEGIRARIRPDIQNLIIPSDGEIFEL